MTFPSTSPLWRSLAASRTAQAALVVLVLLLAAALLAPWLALQNPYDAASLELLDAFTPPLQHGPSGAFHPLGSDDQGRDVFSTVLHGLRTSLVVGLCAVALSLAIGVPLGLLAGYAGGWFDALAMRIADIQLTFPALLIALLVFGLARGLLPVDGRDDLALLLIVAAIGLAEWVPYARTVRGAVQVEKHKDYVLAAQMIGRSHLGILLRHILPNLLAPVLVIATLSVALSVVAEATLSYLGAGLPPTQPSLGTLIRTGQGYLFSGEWWILAFPALALLALALSINLVGDWLRDALNPRLA